MEDMLEKADVALSKREAIIAEMRVRERVTAEDMESLRVDAGLGKLVNVVKTWRRIRQHRSFYRWKILVTEEVGADALSDTKSAHSEVVTRLKIEHSMSIEFMKAQHKETVSTLDSKHSDSLKFSRSELDLAKERFLASLTKS